MKQKHWIYKYLGRPFVLGEFDCGTLAIEIMKNEYGKTVALLDNTRDTSLKMQRILALGLGEYFTQIDTPVDGCLAVMNYGGRSRHVGIFYVHNGTGHVIHVGSRTSGTVTCKVSRLKTQGLQITNYVE